MAKMGSMVASRSSSFILKMEVGGRVRVRVRVRVWYVGLGLGLG